MPLQLEDGTAPVTAYEASEILRKAPSTIHLWAIRYGARKLRMVGRRRYYDFNDLVVIERELRHGHPVPTTWQERAQIRDRCPLVTQASAA